MESCLAIRCELERFENQFVTGSNRQLPFSLRVEFLYQQSPTDERTNK
ncbi:hypothetical protein HSB1_42200 [Halogranum salarium B-1]|uniref:Uncharacterized protein n=1 Tax=Halogranum salarium B-1 TaxID=1210908 RepID=J3ETM2_9EURY|nr:hypothetical protein HSB1_42200 [Halogranum salarium B-1]